MNNWWGIAGTLALTACTAPVPVTITEVGPVEFQHYFTPLDIDDSGRILVQEGPAPAVVQPNGEVVRFPLPAGYTNCLAAEMANDGTIAGTCTGQPNSPQLASPFAVFWDAGGTVHEIDTENRTKTAATAINERGVILGYTYGPDAQLGRVPWIYDVNSQQFTELAVPADTLDMLATGINDAGDVVGTGLFPDADPRDVRRPVAWANGTLTPRLLATAPNSFWVFAHDINNHGVIVGDDVGNAVIWDTASSQPTALPRPAPPPRDPPLLFTTQASAKAINDEGVIIGEATAPTSYDAGTSFGVLWNDDHRPTSVEPRVVAINASSRVLGVTGASGSRRLVLIDYSAP